MEVKVLHEGSLEKCSSADEQVKKDWKKRYFVFKHFPTSSTKCLEYYKDKNWHKQDTKGVLTLHAGYEVVKVHDSKRKYVFDVKTVEHVFRLSAHSEDELNKWILTLEKENVVKSFVVEPVQDVTMAKIGAPNNCHFYIADTEIRLVSAQDGSQIISWPFTCLRRYMSSRGKFTLEAGRRAPSGEGKFTFITTQHDEIYKLLDNVIKSRAGSTGNPPPPPRPTDLVIPVPATQVDDCYDHLMSSPLKGITPAHTIHPNYDQNTISTLNQKSYTARSNDYASPYGHMRQRESVTSAREIDIVHGEGYDTLSHQAVDCTSQNTKVHTDMLNPNKPKRIPPPPPVSTGKTTEDVYNTIDSGGGREEDSYNKLDCVSSSPGNDTYDSLDYQQGLVPKPVRNSVSSPESIDGDTYNVLAHVGTPVSSSVPNDIGGDEYSTLDRTSPHPPLRQSKSFPIPPPRVPSTASDRVSHGYDRSSISSLSSFGSYDHASFRDSRLSMSPVTDDQDVYSSIDNDVPTKQAAPTPPRKINVKNTEADKNRHSLVSSLRASLIADGLNMSKINPQKNQGRRRCSVDTIEESDTYARINEGATQDKKIIINKSSRSPSAPVEPVEDIYEDPDGTSRQEKQLKPKLPGPKPVKPRKKK